MPSEIQVKKLLRKNRFPEAFAGKYAFSPYMGCSHDCKYCDGRYEKYHFEGDLHQDISVRINAPELLAQELPKLREFGPICISSGISDAYQPAERKYGLMSECTSILAEYDFPVILHTKSNLMLRDWLNWEKINRRSGVNLYVSITWLDDSMRQKFEPGASSASERWELLRIAHNAGFKTGVLAMPLIPGISDSDEHIRKLLTKTRELDLDFIWIAGLTLKPGRQKDYFLDFINNEFPRHLQKMTGLYLNNDQYGAPLNGRQFYRQIMPLYEEYGFTDCIPHQVFKGKFALYDEISILLHDMQKLYRLKGIHTARLKTAAFKYAEWLKEQKDYIAHRRNISYNVIDIEIKKQLASGEFSQIIENRKLTVFLQRIFLNNKFLDYSTLELKDETDLTYTFNGNP
ncbi:MAG: radical SAM protein [Candidatus Cloacimonetes bacterium]|nr:radical SAM protein [Candidatus Cloacimonadota bacterium]